MRIVTSEEERRALAALCRLPAIEALAADLVARPEGDAGIRVTGEVEAAVRQVCVVSLDAFTASLRERVDVLFLPEADVDAMAARRGEDEETADDLPDPIRGGRIDLGALTAEILVLGLDPYPRKPGIVWDQAAAAPEEAGGSPFAILGGLGKPGDP